MKKSSSLFFALLIAGCSVGPDYVAPDAVLPAGWVADSNHQLSPKAESDQKWWQNFNDPILTQLITQAAQNNFDLKIAEARIAQARATVSASAFALLPKGDVGADAVREGNRIAFPGGGENSLTSVLHKPFNIFQTGFDANWELDLFGGNRRGEESAVAEMQAAEADRDDVRVSLMAEVARAYTAIRAAQAQLAIADADRIAAQKICALVQQRFDAGQSPGSDVAQADAAVEQAQSHIAPLRDQIAQNEFALDALLGEQPGVARKRVGDKGTLPATDKKIALGAPASIIAQRPDIRVAERKLAAATAQQGVAVAAFFPNLSLSGFFGVLKTSADNLVSPTNQSWQIGGSVLLPILNYGTLSAHLDTADAAQQEAMATYQKTVLGALSDVERALNAYNEQLKTTQAVSNEVKHDQRAAAAAQERYAAGLTSRLEVLQAEHALYAAQQKELQARAATTQNLIALYKSLGGGWK